MHISSLPGKTGIGTFGREAYRFADFCKKSGFTYWQILPLNPTGYGDSPYQSFSSFAGNPYFIDLDDLVELGLLKKEDIKDCKFLKEERYVDYDSIYFEKMSILRHAYDNSGFLKDDITAFKEDNKTWLDDYALYMALKKHFSDKPWNKWDEDMKKREDLALNRYREILCDEIGFYVFLQHLFFKQWKKLKKYVNSLGLQIIGDLPIYISMDSADAWCGRDFLQFDKNLNPAAVAGVPPDYFSDEGQLWGNPLYDWNKLKKNKYGWWIERIKFAMSIYDFTRLDHFRGFANYWRVPYGEKNAVCGTWEKGPGIAFFKELSKKCENIKIIAEDLGVIDNSVNILRDKLKYPGMRVLQFAYDVNDRDNPYLVHNAIENCVYYTGTHDNDTLMGWYSKLDKANKEYVDSYFKIDGGDINFSLLRGAYSSASNLVVACMQDFLGLDSQHRMNTPSTKSENWKWRATLWEINDDLAKKIHHLNTTFSR